MGRNGCFIVTLALAACGDDAGAVDAGSADAGHASDGATITDAPAGASRIFITGAKFTGALMGQGGASAADAACLSAAQAAQLGGTWVAWLSTTTVDAIDRVTDVGPWFDLGGTMIFADRANLMTSPATPLWLDERGSFLASDKIWTATGYGGRFLEVLAGQAPCLDWTSASTQELAQVGQVGQGGAAWTSYFSTGCDGQAHLICLEQ